MHRFNKIQLDTNWFPSKEANVRFGFETRCICALYARLMRKHGLNFSRGRGVVAEFGPDKKQGRCEEPIPSFLFESTRDVREFAGLSDFQKKAFTLELIEYVMGEVAMATGHDHQVFAPVRDEILASNYINSWHWKRGVSVSPDKTLKCDIFVDHEVSFFNIRARVSDRRGGIVQEGLIYTYDKPDELVIDGHLGKIEWLDEGLRLIPRSSFRDAIEIKLENA